MKMLIAEKIVSVFMPILSAAMLIIVGVFCVAFEPAPFDISAVKTYRDIPGVTDEEIAAIEALRQTRESFSYVQMHETEAFILPDGTYAGFAVKFCDLLSELFGIPFVLEIRDWGRLKDDINSMRIDFTGDLTPTAERLRRYFMTHPIAERPQRIFFHADNLGIRTEQDVNGLKIGYLEGSVEADRIRKTYPDLTFDFVPVRCFDTAAEMILSKEIDAFVSEGVVDPMFEDYPQIRSMEFFPFVYNSVSLTTANPELEPIISVVNRYIAAGGIDVLQDLYYAGNTEYARYKLDRSFTDEERAYIKELVTSGRTVKIAPDDGNYPVSFYNRAEKKFSGIALEVLDEISNLTGIVFEIATDEKTQWPQRLEMLRTGEVSLVTELLYSSEREGQFIWAHKPYATARYALISKTRLPTLAPYQVVRARVGVMRATASEYYYNEWFPGNNNLTAYDTEFEMLNALETGEIDLLMGAEYFLLMQQNLYEKPDYKINIRFTAAHLRSYFGFNKDEEALRSIISKAQDYVKTDVISNDWTSRRYDYVKQMTRQKMHFAMVIAALSVAMLIAVFFLLRKNILINRNLDKTVRERTRELEFQTEAAKAASKSKSEFLANMSHEIRTPMNSIIGFSELALSGDIPPKTREYLSKISESADLLLEIINDILDISKIEAGKMVIDRVPCDLNDIFAYCRAVIAPKAEAKGLTLDCRIEPAFERKVIGDSVKLRQALLNMLSNAVKFTDEGKVELTAFVKSVEDEHAVINFEVRDSGIGMTPNQVMRVFEPFMQADSSITRRYGGTGLGLTITQSIVNMMGGVLTVDSEPGIGSNFNFELTFKLADDTGDAFDGGVLREIEKPMFEGEILICEDNGMNQQVLSDHLGMVGLKSVIAENGKVAVDMVAERQKSGKKPFDIIFMDIHMPVMDGIEATRLIKALDTGSPIVAISASLISHSREFYETHGMADSLGKPFKTHELWSCLMKFCRVVSLSRVEMKRYAEDEEKMLRHLRVNFAKSNRNIYEDIMKAVDEGDLKLAHRMAHTLKGNAGQINEIDLQNAAAAVEAALVGEGSLTDEKRAALETELKSALERLDAVLASEAEDDKAQVVDGEEIRKLFDKLENMLRNRNSECMDLLGEIRAVPGAEKLAGFVEDFDFVRAAEELVKLRQETGC